MIDNFILALVLTILIETTVLMSMAFFWKTNDKNFSNKNIIFAGIIASSWTLPYLYFVFPHFMTGDSLILYGEIGVTLMEAIFYMFFFRINILEALFISFCANVISFFLGYLIYIA